MDSDGDDVDGDGDGDGGDNYEDDDDDDDDDDDLDDNDDDFCRCSRRPVPARRAVGAAPEPLSVDDSSDDGSSSDDDSSAASLLEKSSSTSTCVVSFQVCYRISIPFLSYSLGEYDVDLKEPQSVAKVLGTLNGITFYDGVLSF